LAFWLFYAFHQGSAWLWSRQPIKAGPEKSGPGGQKSSAARAQGKFVAMRFRLSRLALAGALLLPLLGCSTKISVCPVPAILADTQSVTVFRPGTAPDMANELYTVSMIDAQGDCTYSTKDNLVKASLDLTFRATRAPQATAATYSVPYFVAVTENARIYTKRLLYLKFTFARGAATATINQSPDDLQLHVSNGKLPWNYEELAGFQMTPEQIDYARKRSRYVP
jgi:hypothetical protein